MVRGKGRGYENSDRGRGTEGERYIEKKIWRMR